MRPALTALLLCACACTGPEPQHFLWSEDKDSLDNPFPDARLLTETGTVLRPDFYTPFIMRKALTRNLKAFFDAYIPDARDHLVGLGNFSPTLLRSSAPVDPASLDGHFARLRKTASGYEVLERSLTIEHATATLEGTGKDAPDGFPEFTLVRVGVPLPEGEEGLLVVTKGIKTKDGEVLGRGNEWSRNNTVDLKGAAAALALKDDSEIVFALPLKAGPISAQYLTMKAWVNTSAGLAAITIPPKDNVDRPVGVWKSTEGDWPVMLRWLEKNAWAKPVTHVGQVVFGELAARDPREAGAWKPAWVADLSQAPVVPLRFVISVPAGSKPSGGWPAVIGAHGLGGRNVPENSDGDSFCLEFAEMLAIAGIACVGIDAPSHGVRGNIFDFFEIEHARIMRENFREMTFDLLQLARAIPAMDIDGDSAPDFSPELGYFGNSLGSIMGASYVALDDRIKYAALNVPGGGLSNILVSTDIRDRIGLLLVAKTSITFDTPEYYSAFPIFRAMAQPFLEGGDPINILGMMPHDRALFIQMGVGDITIPNFTSRGLEVVAQLEEPTAPVTGTAPLRVFYAVDPAQFLPASMLPGYNGHAVIADVPFARTQIVDFLQSKGTEVLAAVSKRDVLGPANLKEGDLRGYRLGKRNVMVACVGGRAKALDDWCNHAGCLLSGGHLEGNTVVCPCHEVGFDLDTGKNVTSPGICDDQNRYETDVADGQLVVIDFPEV